MKLPPAITRHLRPAAPALAALALALLLVLSGMTTTLDRAWFDTLQRAFAPAAPLPDNTAIVLVDEQSLHALGADPYDMRWPWPRRAFAALFAALHSAGAKHILADFIFFEHSTESIDDDLLASTAAALRNVTLGAMRNHPGEAPTLPIIWPQDFREKHPAYFPAPPAAPRWGWVDITPDTDGIIRRYTPAGSLASAATPLPLGEGPGVRESAPPGALLRYRGNLEQLRQRGIPILPAAPFVTTGLRLLDQATTAAPDFDNPSSLEKALAAQPPVSGGIFDTVRGRTIIIGVNAAGTFDAIATPVGAPEPGALAHWTALADLRAGTFLRDTGKPLAYALLLATILFISITARATPKEESMPKNKNTRHSATHSAPLTQHSAIRNPHSTIYSALLALLLLIAGSAALFALANTWLAPAAPATAALMAFATETTAGFLHERARKREIQSWFGAYVSPHVVKNLIRDPTSLNLGGERRDLTVFFSDIAGFTTISEKLSSPEKLVTLINTYLEELSESVLTHGCYLDKYIGDAIMAVFGAPETLENHALAACRAALDSLRRLTTLNERLARDHDGIRLDIRIGINTGPMVVGNVGSHKKKNYTVLGDAVNLGSRLEGANKEFGTRILIGPQTAHLVADTMAVRPVAMLRVKGKNEALTVYELIGERATLTDTQETHLRACTDGFNAWCLRRFDAAADAYANAAHLRPDDLASAAYHQAALTHAATPPPPDWTPILELHSK